VIAIEDVSLRLGGSLVLDGLDASVERGEFVGLIGPNGAGKTTLLRAVAGSLDLESGRVRVDGEDVHALSSREASRRLAVVPQDTELAFDFDVRDVVAMGRTPYRTRLRGSTPTDRPAVERAMQQTTVEAFADRSIGSLSGGERQRVLLARALAQETPVLLLDEPTASLDIDHQVRTLELVSDLVADGKTVIAAIHDLNLAAHYCDSLRLLSGGRIVASGPPDVVLTSDTLGEAFGTNAVVSRHPVTGSVYVTALPEGRRGSADGSVHVIGGGGTASRLLYLLSAAGYDVSVGALNEGDADLETARALGLDVVTVPPYSPVDEAAASTVRERVTRSDVTVVADVEVGEGNVSNLEAAAAGESLVVVEERPFGDRNYAGDDATARYETLRSRGTVVEPESVLGAVRDALSG